MIRRLFGPANSLILLYDHLTREQGQELEDQVEEVARYYRFVKPSELLQGISRGKVNGMAVIAFRHARKSVFLHAVPFLLAREFPFLLFADPDCVGLNRLPAEEELEAYRVHYGEASTQGAPSAWTEPDACNAFLEGLRSTVGPLPLEQMDSTRFFTTWGKIVEISPQGREIGLSLASDPANDEKFLGSLAFVRRQVGSVQLVFSPRPVSAAKLKSAGLEGVLTLREGAVEKDTDPWDLPRWSLVES